MNNNFISFTLFILFIYLFIYNNFICKEHRKKGAAREELHPHLQQPPKQIRIKQYNIWINIKYRKIKKL